MSLNADFIFASRHISGSLISALNLPSNVWYLVINDALNHASYLDNRFDVHHQHIAEEVRSAVAQAVLTQPA